MRYAISGAVCALAAMITTPGATGEGTCPPDAGQSMYDYLAALQANETVDLNEVSALMQVSIGQCSEDKELLNLIVYLTGVFAANATDANIVKHWVNTGVTAYEMATEQEKQGYTPSNDWTGRDGEPASFYPYNYATQAFEDHHIPRLVALKAAGYTHPIISDAPLERCIFSDRTETRLLDEAKAWVNQAEKDPENAFVPATSRLAALHKACTDFAWITNLLLGEVYANEADRLADAGHWSGTAAEMNAELLKEAKAYATRALKHYDYGLRVPDDQMQPVSDFAFAQRKEKMKQLAAIEIPD